MIASFRTVCLTAAMLLSLAAVFAAPSGVRAGEPAWKALGWGGGGRFTAIAVDPSDSSRVYVGSDVAGFFVSTDKGQHFALRGAGLDGFAVAAIAVDPENTARVLILTDAGLYQSQDHGETVSLVSTKIRYRARFFGSHLLLRFDGVWYAAADLGGVFRLERGADGNWREKPLFGLEGKKVNSLAASGGRLLAATDEGVFFYDGEIWKHASEGLPYKERDMRDMSAGPDGQVYAVEHHGGLYALDAAQQLWVRRGPHPASLPSHSGPRQFKALAVSPADPRVVFLGTDPEGWPHLLLRSEDGGTAWSLVKRFTLTGGEDNWTKDLASIEQIAFAADGRSAYLTDWWNVWRSADGGASWLQLRDGLQNTVVNDIRVHPDNPKVLFAAADDNGLMVSTDGGHSWRRKMRGVEDGNAAAVRISSKNPNLVYLLINPWKSRDTEDIKYFHLYRSQDGGETWESLLFKDKRRNLDKPWADGRSTNLVIDPTRDDVVYVGNNGYGIYKVDASQPAAGPDKTVPAKNISAGMSSACIKGQSALMVSAADPRVMLAGTQEAGIFRTQDGGDTWKLVGGAKTFIFGMAADPADPAVIYAGTSEKGLLKSTDGGLTWHGLTLPGGHMPHVAVSAVAVTPARNGSPGVLVVGTMGYDLKPGDGVYLSQDGGKTFTPAPATLPRVGVLALTPSPNPGGLVLAGFNGLGVFELDEAGTAVGKNGN